MLTEFNQTCSVSFKYLKHWNNKTYWQKKHGTTVYEWSSIGTVGVNNIFHESEIAKCCLFSNKNKVVSSLAQMSLFGHMLICVRKMHFDTHKRYNYPFGLMYK